MNSNPILIVPGEIKSIFFEIFFKTLKLKLYKSPIILICNREILFSEVDKFNFKKKIEEIDIKKIDKKKLKNKKFYFINISDKNSKSYIQRCFICAFQLLKKGFSNKFLNGPIDKTKTLEKRYLGVTEYIAKSFNKKKFAMLIYSKDLSVCPITTHLPLNLVSKEITKKLIKEKV